MRTLFRTIGELLVTLGLIVLLFIAYQLWGTGDYTRHAQDQMRDRLTRQWSGPTQTDKVVVTPGRPFAVIRIPRLGRAYAFAVVEGVSPADLRRGPGHYPGTALPGGLGNMVISGHRTTYLAPFNRLDELRPGDQIVIQVGHTDYVYRVSGRRVVLPTQVEVVAPVPFHPGRHPREHLITLTTCHPKFSASHRLIIFGRLAGVHPVAA